MKKISIISFMLVLCMCLAAFSGCAKKSDDAAPSGMKLASENVDYCLYVPTTWRVDRSDLFTSATFSSGDPTNISATAYAISSDISSVEDWWKIFEERMDEMYTDRTEVQITDATLGGIEGKEFSFEGKFGEQEYNVIITAVIKDFYVYYVTYTSVPAYNENHLEERTQMIEAFKFKS